MKTRQRKPRNTPAEPRAPGREYHAFAKRPSAFAASDPHRLDSDGWIYGRHPALAAIANPQRRIERIVAVPEHAPLIAGAAAARREALPAPVFIGPRDLAELLPEGAVHQGLAVLAAPLAVLHLETLIADADPQRATIVVLDQATDPRNVGAVLRAAAAFKAIGVVIQDRHAPPASGALAKAASGALEHVPLVRTVNIARALRTLQAAGFWCAGFAGDGAIPIDAASLGGRLALVLGAEDSGLRRLVRETCDEIVRIPLAAAVESLNLATATTVALYEVSRRAGWPDATPPQRATTASGAPR